MVWANIVAAEPATTPPGGQILEPAIWHGPELNLQASPSQLAATNSLRVSLQPAPPVPPQSIQVAPTTPAEIPPPATTSRLPAALSNSTATPLLDDAVPPESLMPSVVEDENVAGDGRPHVRPYGGGHPGDWSWGCGGSPYRTGPGPCDNYRVGPRWHITVDGLVLSREHTDLAAIADEMEDNHQGEEDLDDPTFEQFDRGPGGRIMLTSQVPQCAGFQVQVGYEGIEAWNSSVVFEKEDLEPEFFTSVITTQTTTVTNTTGDPLNNPPPVMNTTTTTTTTTTTYAPGPLPLQPGDPFPEGFEQRSLHYRSNYHSGELNILRGSGQWRPYCGVRYLHFDDEINDFTNQDAQPPLPFEGPDNVPPGEFLAVATTDRLNLFDIQNDLMGFQVGLVHDSWKVSRRFAIEGFVNGGVYYNKVKYTNLMGIFTTQVIADDTSTVSVNESRTDFSNAVNNDVREYSEISYHGEASLSGVCRLNKCWAVRGGYQALWIANIHLAEDAYLGDENVARDLFFHGWHAGIECRR